MTFTKYNSPEMVERRDAQKKSVDKFTEFFYIHLTAMRREYPEPFVHVTMNDSFAHKLGRVVIRSFSIGGEDVHLAFKLAWNDPSLVVYHLATTGETVSPPTVSAPQRDIDTLNWVAYKTVQLLFAAQIKERKCNQQCSTKDGVPTSPVSPAAMDQITPSSGLQDGTQQTNSINKTKETQ